MKAKLAIFDLDGTLFDTKEVNYYAYKEAVSEYGYDMDYEYYCKFCNGRHFKDFLPRVTTGDEQVLQEIHKKKKGIYKKYLHKAIPNKHLFHLIKLMKEEYYLAVVTTASKKNCEDILHKFKVYGLFDLVMTYEDVVQIKPDPEGFFKAMDHFQIGEENTIIFEDSPVGVEAAKASGAAYMIVAGYN